MNETITISMERYNQLIRAEHEANHLKSLMYIGNKEDGNV